MMEGAAYDEDAKLAMTNCQVLAHWRLLPIELELAVREVKWLQAICGGGAAHDQLIGALFGELKVGGVRMFSALNHTGKLSGVASPYAKKMISNLNYFRPLETAKEFFPGGPLLGKAYLDCWRTKTSKLTWGRFLPPSLEPPSGRAPTNPGNKSKLL